MVGDAVAAAAVLEQLYVVRSDTPRRFHLSAEALRKEVAGRARLTAEFLEDLRSELRGRGILMSLDRTVREERFWFVSDELASRWSAVSDDLISRAIREVKRAPTAEQLQDQTAHGRNLNRSGPLAVERLSWLLANYEPQVTPGPMARGHEQSAASNHVVITKDQFARLTGSQRLLSVRVADALRTAQAKATSQKLVFFQFWDDRFAVLPEPFAWGEPLAQIAEARRRALPRWIEERDN